MQHTKEKPPPYNPWSGVQYLGVGANTDLAFKATLPNGELVGYFPTLQAGVEARRAAMTIWEAERHQAYLSRHPEAQSEQQVLTAAIKGEWSPQNSFAGRYEEG